MKCVGLTTSRTVVCGGDVDVFRVQVTEEDYQVEVAVEEDDTAHGGHCGRAC